MEKMTVEVMKNDGNGGGECGNDVQDNERIL